MWQNRFCCRPAASDKWDKVVFRFVVSVPGMNAREISKSLSDLKVFHTTTQTINVWYFKTLRDNWLEYIKNWEWIPIKDGNGLQYGQTWKPRQTSDLQVTGNTTRGCKCFVCCNNTSFLSWEIEAFLRFFSVSGIKWNKSKWKTPYMERAPFHRLPWSRM